MLKRKYKTQLRLLDCSARWTFVKGGRSLKIAGS